jgi:hypothetical protein
MNAFDMGYELHLVKSGNWFDEANQFTESEWEGLRRKQAIPEWVYFSSGDISVKNPQTQQIIVLVKIAKDNGWSVQGDDGETYSKNGAPIPIEDEKPGIFESLKRLVQEYKAKRKIKQMMKGAVCPFKIGDKVRMLGAAQTGIVTKIDYKANHGIGSFTVELQNGTVDKTFGFDAHAYQKED